MEMGGELPYLLFRQGIDEAQFKDGSLGESLPGILIADPGGGYTYPGRPELAAVEGKGFRLALQILEAVHDHGGPQAGVAGDHKLLHPIPLVRKIYRAPGSPACAD